MATSDTSLVLRVPARICINPTNISYTPGPSSAPLVFVFFASGGTQPAGTRLAAYSFVYPSGESALSPAFSTTLALGDYILFDAPFNLPSGATSAKFYLTKANGATYYLVGSVSGAGSFVLNCRTLSDASLVTAYSGSLVATKTFPFGGTELGLVRSATFRSHQVSVSISEEPYGEEKVDLLDLGQDWTFECELRGLDPNAVATVFPAFAAGPVSGRTDVVYPGATFRAGTLRSASAVKLIVVPLDTNRHPCWYLPNALPIVASDEEEELQADKELVVKAIFQATRDATGRVFLRRRLEDLTL